MVTVLWFRSYAHIWWFEGICKRKSMQNGREMDFNQGNVVWNRIDEGFLKPGKEMKTIQVLGVFRSGQRVVIMCLSPQKKIQRGFGQAQYWILWVHTWDTWMEHHGMTTGRSMWSQFLNIFKLKRSKMMIRSFSIYKCTKRKLFWHNYLQGAWKDARCWKPGWSFI